jgi:hypothetical protein
MANILGGVQEEIKLAFEAELELDEYGVFLRIADARY